MIITTAEQRVLQFCSDAQLEPLWHWRCAHIAAGCKNREASLLFCFVPRFCVFFFPPFLFRSQWLNIADMSPWRAYCVFGLLMVPPWRIKCGINML